MATFVTVNVRNLSTTITYSLLCLLSHPYVPKLSPKMSAMQLAPFGSLSTFPTVDSPFDAEPANLFAHKTERELGTHGQVHSSTQHKKIL